MSTKPSRLPAENERIRFLLEVLFEGNQSKMADVIGIPQPVISRVVTGKLRPGKKLLSALAGHPKVNPAWLATGKGDPLLAAEASTAGGWPVPVASCLLPCPPSDCRSLLSPMVHYVAGAIYRDSLYAVKANSAMSQELADVLRILPDDLFLVESDSKVWTQNFRLLNRRLVAVRTPTTAGHQVVLREVEVSEQTDKCELITLSTETMRERRAQLMQAAERIKEYRREDRGITLPNERTAVPETEPELLDPHQIVGLVIQLVRNF